MAPRFACTARLAGGVVDGGHHQYGEVGGLVFDGLRHQSWAGVRGGLVLFWLVDKNLETPALMPVITDVA